MASQARVAVEVVRAANQEAESLASPESQAWRTTTPAGPVGGAMMCEVLPPLTPMVGPQAVLGRERGTSPMGCTLARVASLALTALRTMMMTAVGGMAANTMLIPRATSGTMMAMATSGR